MLRARGPYSAACGPDVPTGDSSVQDGAVHRKPTALAPAMRFGRRLSTSPEAGLPGWMLVQTSV